MLWASQGSALGLALVPGACASHNWDELLGLTHD